MPKYYCDYCEVQLTHDSPSVRKTHNSGWKHKNAVKAWFQQFEVDVIQMLIDQKCKEFEDRMAAAGTPIQRTLPPPERSDGPPFGDHHGHGGGFRGRGGFRGGFRGAPFARR